MGVLMEDMHISLVSAALAALIAVWLGWRCGKLRMSEKILHGDGGHVLLHRRMRAQSNFTEYTPFVLILILLLDLYGKDGWMLGITALLYFAGRVLHAIGMEADHPARSRQIGMVITWLALLGLALAALLAAFRVI